MRHRMTFRPKTPPMSDRPQRLPAFHTLRLVLLVEAVSFAAAALIHGGVFIAGYEHPLASRAEGVIALVLFAGLALALVQRAWTRGVALLAQAFALLGTLVGVFTIVIGVGPRTVPDLVYHAAIVVVLVWGLSVAARAGSGVAEG